MVDNILGEKKEKGIDVESIDDILNAEFEDDVGGGNVQKLEEGVKIGKTDEVLEETLGSDIAEIEKPVKVSEKTKGVDEIDIGDLVGDKKPKESVPEEKDKEKEKKSVKQKKKVKVDDDIESIIGSSETPEKPTPPTEMDIGLEEELSLGGKEIEEEVKKVKEEVEDDFFKEPEKILLYAATKVGKTHAIASLIEAKLNERPDTKFYVIITDAGFWKTVLRYWRLKKLNTDVLKKQIIYRPILDLNELFPVLT